MLFTGGVSTNQPVDGTFEQITINFTYPIVNASSFNGEDQPVNPPIQLAQVEARLTDNSKAYINPNDQTIKWFYYAKGTPDLTASYNESTGQWEGVEDSIHIEPLPLKQRVYYQLRVLGQNGVNGDWSDVQQVFDNPPAIPAPVISSVKTNKNNQVKIDWSDVASQITNFSHYEILKEEVDTSARLETSALIVGEN